MNWKKFFEVTGWVVGLAALVIGFVHVLEIRSTAHELGQLQTSLSSDLGTVKSSLSTRYAGRFPDFMDDVVATVKSAQHELNILCDVPSYGDFSDPHRALLLRQLIEQKIQAGVKVQVICLSKQRRVAGLHAQFDRPGIEKALSSSEGKAPLLKYLGILDDSRHPLTYENFLAGVEANDEVAISQTYRGADVVQVDTDIPMFFWIADGKSGVMAVQTLGAKDEYGFRTSDQALIIALLATRDRYCHK